MSKAQYAKDLEQWRKRKQMLSDPDHTKRYEDYQGVEDPMGRSEAEFRRVIKDALAMGMKPQNLVGEVRAIAKEIEEFEKNKK